MAADVHAAIKQLLPDVVADLVRVTTERQLLADLGERAERNATYRIVLVVGHSNIEKLALAQDSAPSWSGVAKWLSPFRPKVMVLGACEAGRWLPSQTLFRGIESLREIYGSPVPTTQAQLLPLQALTLYLLAGRRVAKDYLRSAQTVAFALTGGVIFRQTRAEASGDPVEALLWTGLEDTVRKVLRR